MWETDQEAWHEWQRELVWAAGLFDGEGCLTFSGNQAVMKLSSTDEDIVRRFHDAVLGFGTVRVEPYYQRRFGHKLQWQWKVGARYEVLEVISMLYPELCDRRRRRADELRTHIRTQLRAA